MFTVENKISDNETEVLGVDKPLLHLLHLPTLRGRVRYKNKRLAETPLRQVSRLAKSHVSADDNQYRHILDCCLIRGFRPSRGGGRVRLVDDLAIKGLDFVVSRRHLVDEDILDGVSIGDCVPVEEDRRGGLAVERSYRGAVFLERGVKRLDELGGSCTYHS